MSAARRGVPPPSGALFLPNAKRRRSKAHQGWPLLHGDALLVEDRRVARKRDEERARGVLSKPVLAHAGHYGRQGRVGRLSEVGDRDLGPDRALLQANLRERFHPLSLVGVEKEAE